MKNLFALLSAFLLILHHTQTHPTCLSTAGQGIQIAN